MTAAPPPFARNRVVFPVLAAVLVLLIALLPPERSLGHIIKVVFVHAALVRVGLLAFAAAGILALLFLAKKSDVLLQWILAVQYTAVLIWALYVISSLVATKLAWGEWIAWNEPRVRASIHVMWFSVISLGLVLWLKNRLFTAVANILVAATTWMLIKGAVLMRHPFDPIGASDSIVYKILFFAIVLVVLGLAVQTVFWLFGNKAIYFQTNQRTQV